MPLNISSLVEIVQGLMVHIFWAERYGLSLDDERKQEVGLRSARRKLQRMLELDSRPLCEPRPLERRLVGNCRDFSVVVTAFLRHRGIPARARCGFGAYFLPNHFEDHWVVEYWQQPAGRWVMVDSQLDAMQRQVLEITFNTLDMPPGQFVTGGEAWQICRTGQADPDAFGIFDMHGKGFVRGNLVRDLLALNKVEILPRDVWGLVALPDDQLTPTDLAWLDRAARLTRAGNGAFEQVQQAYQEEPRIHVD